MLELRSNENKMSDGGRPARKASRSDAGVGARVANTAGVGIMESVIAERLAVSSIDWLGIWVFAALLKIVIGPKRLEIGKMKTAVLIVSATKVE